MVGDKNGQPSGLPGISKGVACMRSELGRFLLLLVLLAVCGLASAQTRFPLGGNGTMGLGNRNGDFFVEQDDLRVKVPGGYARINRDYDGREWVFNRQWSGLGDPNYYKASYPTIGAYFTCHVIDGVDSCDTTASAGASMLMAGPLAADYTLPAARIPNDPSFGRAPAGGGEAPETRFIARKGVGFSRSADGTSYTSAEHPRYIIRPQSVPVLPVSAGPDAHPATGRPGAGGLQTQAVDGYRWTDRSGQWIEYDGFGRITSYGNRNDARVWMQYGGHGQLERVIDDNGRTVFTLLYTSGDARFIREVRDHTPTDGSIRRVQYQYDDKGRLRNVIDARNHTTSFDYGAINSVSYEGTGTLGAGTSTGGSAAAMLNVDTRFKIVKVTDAEGRVTEVGYGVTARMTKIVAPDKGVTEFDYGYDKLKKEFSVTVRYPQTAAGRKIEIVKFDQEGRPTYREVNGKPVMTAQGGSRSMTYTDERNGSTTVLRDNFDEVVRITYADGASRTYVYEAGSSDLREMVDEVGTVRQVVRDAKGNPLTVKVAAGRPEQVTTEYVHNSRGETELVRRKGGNNPDGSSDPDVEMHFIRDDNGNVAELLDGESKRWTYEYDHQGNLTRATDPLNHAWVYTYDVHGNLLTETDPNQHTTRYTYDKTDLPLTVTDARGKVTRYGYDAAGRDATITDPYGATFTDTYDAAGRLASRNDAAGQKATLSYDSAGRLTRLVDGENFETLLDYADPDGVDRGTSKPGKITYPTFQRLFRYDNRNRAVQQTELLGQDALVIGATHDARGRLRTLTNPNGHTQSFEYDALGRTVSVIDELGGVVKMGYDHRSNLRSITDARGKTSRMAYDKRGLLVSETNPLGEALTYAYDDAGQQVELKRHNGARILTQYDPAGRVERRESRRADGSLEQADTFTWDDADNLKSWANGHASGLLEYDDADRLLSEAVTIDGVTLRRAYTYHPNNKIKTYTGPDGVTLTYSYDRNGELARVDIPGEGSISVTEWNWTAPKKITLPGGTVQEMDRDGHQNLLRLRVKSPSQAVLFELENSFGKLRELSNRRADGKLTRFEYDEAVRLTKAEPEFVGGTSETYVIDKAGNREQHSAVSGTWEYDDANRLKRRGQVAYTYDSAGNLIGKVDASLSEPLRTTHFDYDGYNRLVRVRDGAGAVMATYSYDPFGYRLSKEVFGPGAARSGASPGKTLFLHGEEGLLAETDAAGTVVRNYGWHPEHDYATYPLFQRTSDGYFYYHNDHLGTPWRVTNRDGAVVWSAQDYNAFGTAKVAAGAQITQPWRFPGQYLDAETGLHYNLQRYYEPETGRYTSEDPLGFGSDTNFYAYARHAPTNLTDPTGEILPLLGCLAWNYLRCVAACSVIDLAGQALTDPCAIDVKETIKQCLKDCIWDMLPIPNPCGRLGKWLSVAMGAYEGVTAAQDAYNSATGPDNSFTGDTLVATPSGKRRIEDLRPGDKVLAYAEWKGQTQEEEVTDIALSNRQQTLVSLTLESGEIIQVTGGHPLHTPEGWRPAQSLRAGDQVNVRNAKGTLIPTSLVGVARRQQTVVVYNLEVANAHTFFAGEDGLLVHNGTGAYYLEFDDGTSYAGKGDEARMRQSMREKESQRGKHGRKRKCTFFGHADAGNDRDSFIMEDQMIEASGGVGPHNPDLLNKINSPGRRIRGR